MKTMFCTRVNLLHLCPYSLQSVPEPTKSYVTEWYKDSFSKMSYSYIKPGGSGEVYETLADSVNDRVFFAGEVRINV